MLSSSCVGTGDRMIALRWGASADPPVSRSCGTVHAHQPLREQCIRTHSGSRASGRRVASGHAVAALPSTASNSRRPMVTVIRPSRARCVMETIPRHERAVLSGTRRGRGGTPSTRRNGARPAHVFWFETAFDRQRSSGRIRNDRLWKCETRWRHSPLTFAAVMIGVQRAISLLTSTASGF